MKKIANRKPLSIKKLVDSSYLPLDVLHKIWEDRKLLEFSHWLPHWFQRRILEIKQVNGVNIAGLSGKKEYNSGIYTRVFLDDSHQVIICVHKYNYHKKEIQVALRTYKKLMGIVGELENISHLSIINGMDFCVDLPNEFFGNCPKWTEKDLQECIFQELSEEAYCIDSYRESYGVICNKRYVPGAWNVMLYPNSLSLTSLSCIKKAKPRIDSLLDNLFHTRTDVALGVLPLDYKEMMQYKRDIKI